MTAAQFSPSALERFAEAYGAIVEPDDAYVYAAYLIARDVGNRVESGETLPSVLNELGVRKPEVFANRIESLRRQEPSLSIVDPSGEQKGRRLDFENGIHASTFSILVGGSVGGVPTPECMQDHLPRGRRPTTEEIRKAYEACRK